MRNALRYGDSRISSVLLLPALYLRGECFRADCAGTCRTFSLDLLPT